jgi:uncharacterized protein (TIGR02453 family)
MFNGFTHETLEFFMAIRFNNNREFFKDSEAWYRRAVREPCLALAEALAPAVAKLDPLLETRPHRVVSRINRDVRFSNDKSPYRDYVWLAFRRPGEERRTTLGVFFDMSDEGASYGMGFYDENRPIMNALRRRIETEPDAVRAVTGRALERFQLSAKAFKRIKIPDAVPEDLRPFYPLRGFYVSRDIPVSALMSGALAEEIIGGYAWLTPLYRYIMSLEPIEQEG